MRDYVALNAEHSIVEARREIRRNKVNFVHSKAIHSAILLGTLCFSLQASAWYLNGSGHYSIRPEFKEHPMFQKGTGNHDAIDHNLRLGIEGRATEKASLFFEFRVSDDLRESYLGDQAQCEGANCQDQNPLDPKYDNYIPKLSQLYMQYAFDLCLLKAGRRGRDWGLGVLYDSGKGLFDPEYSVFDGVSCEMNLTSSQTLGFEVGYDKLQETSRVAGLNSGATSRSDDLSQVYLSVELDDRHVGSASSFKKHIGLYGSWIFGERHETDIQFIDVYTALYYKGFSFANEFVFRLGESKDPALTSFGGRGSRTNGDPIAKSAESVAFAGYFDYVFLESGDMSAPNRFNKGTSSRHGVRLEYAFAPGDADGYLAEDDTERDERAAAFAFHRNFQPAQILFRERNYSDNNIVPGAFDPGRLVNAYLLGLSYRYEDMKYGNFNLKLLTASLLESMPDSVKAAQANQAVKSVGYEGNDLGFEVDFNYTYKWGENIEAGLDAAYAIAGKAFEIQDDQTSDSFLVSVFAGYKF